jgi:Signal transduction histidine kinase
MMRRLKTLLLGGGQAIVRRVRTRPDTEFQQAFIRIIIGLAFAFYFTDRDVLVGYPEHAARVVFLMWAFVTWAVTLTLLALLSREVSPVRRYLGMLSDTLITTYLMAVTGEAGAALVFVYLWVTLGNGFRYGIRYLLACGGLSAAGFGFVVAASPFWQMHTGIATGLMIMLVLIPAYTVFLLKQLYRAIAQAKAANAAKSAFLANMSHELRTPLNGVIGIADLLRETPLNKEQQELTQVIHASALALHRLIENVLDISRIEAGKLICVNEDYDLHYLINSLVMMLEPQAHRKGLLLAAHIAPRTPFSCTAMSSICARC